MIGLDTILYIVGAKKGVPKAIVEKEWNIMLDRILFSIAFGNLVRIIGFGSFFEYQKKVYFMRNTAALNKTVKAIVNEKFDDVPPIIYNDFMLPPLENNVLKVIDSIRLKHYASDELAIAIFIEINRQMIFKKHTIVIPELGVLQDNYAILQFVEIEKIKQNIQMQKISAWIPRLILRIVQ